MPAREMTVTGLVQGVGFRVAVSRWGHQLGLNGYVRNRADGSVFILVEGPEEKLSFFENMVKDGCGTFAHIDEVTVTTPETVPVLRGFVVR